MYQKVIIDDLLSLNVSELSRLGLLTPNWHSNEEITICGITIRISVSTYSENSYLRLRYNINGIPIDYKLILIQVPNNISERLASSWYFLCPFTNLKCKKLYFDGLHFLHRTGIANGIYYQQSLSKNQRRAFIKGKKLKSIGGVIRMSRLKYFMHHRAGNETKRLKQLKKAQAELKHLASIPN